MKKSNPWPPNNLLDYVGLSREAWEKMEEEIYTEHIRDFILNDERIKNIIVNTVIEKVWKKASYETSI